MTVKTGEKVRKYRAEYPGSTVRDIQRALGISSPSVVQYHLKGGSRVAKAEMISDGAVALPDSHPIMTAWAEYTSTDAARNSLNWANKGGPHSVGSMWAAFEAGYRLATIREASKVVC